MTELVLVIDDNVEILQTIQEYVLAPLGYQVMVVADSTLGLEMALQSQPDLILLDINMYPLSGFEILRRLRAARCQAPVILMTAEGSEQIAVTAFRMGIYDYLIKPFDIEEAQKIIKDALWESRLVQEREQMNRSLLVAETVRQTVTTLAHYLNNQLMVANGSLLLIEEEMEENPILPRHKRMLKVIEAGQFGLMRIEAVVQVLRKLTDVKPADYDGQIQMLDIKTAVAHEFNLIRRRHQLHSVKQP